MPLKAFHEETNPQALHAWIVINLKPHRLLKKGTETSFWQPVNYLLEMNVNDDVIVEPDADKMKSTQPSNKAQTKYARTF